MPCDSPLQHSAQIAVTFWVKLLGHTVGRVDASGKMQVTVGQSGGCSAMDEVGPVGPDGVGHLAFPRVTFLGGRSAFSALSLRALLEAGVRVARVLVSPMEDGSGAVGAVASSFSAIPLRQPDPLDEVVRNAGLVEPEPVLLAAGQVQLAASADDVAVCACFGARLSEASLAGFHNGVLNIHPSLLPAYRGPAPLYWQYRDGCSRFGVSVHRMVSALDAGPILAQADLVVGPRMGGLMVEQQLAAMGGELTARLLTRPIPRGSPQDEALATYQTWPDERHYRISPLWTAERAFRFMQGTAHHGVAFKVQILAEQFRLERVLDFDANVKLPRPYVRDGRRIEIAMRPGVLTARLSGS